MKRITTTIVAALALAGCATDSGLSDDGLMAMLAGESSLQGSRLEKAVAAAAAYPLGDERNPVRVAGPAGERAYLSRLRCADGRAPTFGRGGSVGIGPFGNILDVYGVDCIDSTPPSSSIYMDMYHAGRIENEGIEGFTIVP